MPEQIDIVPGVVAYCGDALAVLKELPSGSVNTICTSPPYHGLRDYNTGKWIGGDPSCSHKATNTDRGERADLDNSERVTPYKSVCPKCGAVREDCQIGLEEDFTEYISRLCDVFDECKRVLRDDGICWVNLGDCYSAKCLNMIPARFAIEMINRGWRLRQEVVWSKNNPCPSSVKDRFTSSHEMFYMFTKGSNYWFEQQFEPIKAVGAKSRNAPNKCKGYGNPTYSGFSYDAEDYPFGRNKRDVWYLPAANYPGSHFATFPPRLIEVPILSSCPEKICCDCGKPVKVRYGLTDEDLEEWKAASGADKSGEYSGTAHKDFSSAKVQNASDMKRRILARMKKKQRIEEPCSCGAPFRPGVVLDPFFGAGTTGMVAARLGRHCIGIDLNPEYLEIAKKRIQEDIAKASGHKQRKTMERPLDAFVQEEGSLS